MFSTKVVVKTWNLTPLKLYYRAFSFAHSYSQNEKDVQSDWKSAKPYQTIPGPSVLQMIARFLPGGKYHKIELLGLHEKLKEEYGRISKLPGMFGNQELVMVTESSDFELVFRTEGIWPNRRGFSTFDHYRKKMRPDIFKDMGGLVSEQNERWAKMRSIVSPIMLKPATVNAYIPDVDEIAIEFCDRIKALRDDKNELPANFMYELNKWSLESIASIALDQRMHILDSRNDDQNSKAGQLIRAVYEFFTLSFELEMVPSLWRYVKTPKYKKLMNVYDNMTNCTLYYIDGALKKLDKNSNALNQHREPSVLEKLLKINKDAAIVMAIDMLLAGVDTTTAATAHILYYLSKNPEKQEKLRDELQHLPTDVNGRLMPSSFLTAPYLRSCIKETLRLLPITPGNVRASGSDLVIQGYRIPKGTDILMANMILHYDEREFKNPTEFMPERWLKKHIPNACPEAKASNPFIYLPFGFGPRSCIGRRFAEMEMNVLLTRLLTKYRIEFHYGPLKHRQSFVLTPINDLKFKLNEIKQ